MENQGHTRKEFMQTAAVTGAAAILAGAGFNRMADAAHHESITQLAIFGYDPEKADEAAENLAKLAKAVEDAEPGVLAYMPHLDEKNNEVVFFEVYKDQESLTAHGKQPHMAMLRPLFGTVFKPPLKIVKLKNVGGFYR